MSKILDKFLEKFPIIKYIISAFIKFFLWAVGILLILFPILFFTGLYGKIESLLDLKYNSPFVIVPLFGFLALAIISFLIGALMYFHKYKRSKVDSAFAKKLNQLLRDR